MARRPKKRLTRKEQWELFKRAFPEARALAYPYRHLLLGGCVLLLINRLASLVLPAAPKFLIDDALANKDLNLLYIIITAVVIASLIQGVTIFFLTQTISKAGQRLIRDLRAKLHDHIIHLPLRYFDQNRSGEVAARVMSDVEGVRNLIGTGIIELLNGALTALFVGIILLYMNWKLTVMSVSFMGIFAIIVVRAFAHLRPIFQERQETNSLVYGRLIESFGGVRVVKAYTTEEREGTVFGEGIDKLLQAILRTINTIALLALSTSGLVGVLGALVLFVAGHQIMAGEMTPGELLSYAFYLVMLIGPVAQAVSISSALSEAFAGLDRMREVLNVQREDADNSDRTPIEKIDGRIEFEDVGFQYEEGKPVLSGVSFLGEPGSVNALVGPSGSGKSTIMGLIAGFYKPLSGRVIVDGRDLSGVRLDSYRAQLGVVLQENFLFDGTVKENLLYARPDATMEQLTEAAQTANCLEFILSLADGWETIIGERGVKLSGGQRQRIAIARAILANPRILLLDEATSSLDSESEALIQEGLKALMKGRTTFVIAHRLSTVRSATQILVVENGEIVERGRHAELLRAKGRYHDMYTLQHGLDDRIGEDENESEKAEDSANGGDDPSDRRGRDPLEKILG